MNSLKYYLMSLLVAALVTHGAIFYKKIDITLDEYIAANLFYIIPLTLIFGVAYWINFALGKSSR